ncbi:FAD-dependent oxidoreductase [Actinoplanes regularis]|uniref:NADPH-dependent 2,4-dienoyl-CoA reductase, sulfur reductase n=1 Tax=Actinoplanes regularis TaxID=52697 RepID=A0A239GIT2_9ACTN|nr:FAD-dependent oxidoreductase [Actinoplanes regularis]GIE90625.1 flavoprotein oxidoreductase [Actinoplanes regularis]SNS68702.1 NADPH-dependent 2,4-dienoyl-CoA reductase, sulfur reductase [Actinoplanes regularis]
MRLIVIGGDAAGMSAAAQARRGRGPDELEIHAFELGRFVSYSACGIPYWIGGVVDGRDRLIARTPAEFRKAGIEVHTRHEVTGIDLDARTVTVRDLDAGSTRREGFDELVYATGATPVRPPWADITGKGVFGVQTLEDGDALREWLATEKPETAVVIGAGYIGVEIAEALIKRGLRVTLVERAQQPMGTIDDDMGALLATTIRDLGIDLRTGVTVQGLETANGKIRAVATDAGPLPAGVVVIGLGVRPNTALAEAAGLPLGATGGLRTDQRQQVAGGVWAAGDCTEVHHRVSGGQVHVPLGTHANKQGRVAGINIGGGHATFPGVIGTAVTKLCDLEVARTGLSSAEAARARFETVTATIESTNRAGYFPGAVPMTVKVIAERETGMLLGAQIVGRTEAAKRIDAFAVAIWNRMTVGEMTGLDLGYAPPYAPVWDPILVAARKAEQELDRHRP